MCRCLLDITVRTTSFICNERRQVPDGEGARSLSASFAERNSEVQQISTHIFRRLLYRSGSSDIQGEYQEQPG